MTMDAVVVIRAPASDYSGAPPVVRSRYEETENLAAESNEERRQKTITVDSYGTSGSTNVGSELYATLLRLLSAIYIVLRDLNR